ncbi:MAG: cupin domain-containing protein [Longimonas sp.]|uniref:cupin domain-containing protein n=1 Tax=Longimonas sp. TaxID=2039626 RepID=UPI0039762D5D
MDRIYNPVHNDTVTFRTTANESDGAKTVIEIELPPGGRDAEHYHDAFTEHVEVLEGALTIGIDGATRTLRRGNRTSVGRDVPHFFENRTDEPVRFRVEMRPGHRGFEHMLRILYGLARDGAVNDEGRPTKLTHSAALTDLGGTTRTATPTLVRWGMQLLAQLPPVQKTQADLKARYVPDTDA